MDRKINRFSSNRHIFASLPLRLFGHFVRVAGGGDLEVEDLKRRDKFENLRRETTLTTDKLSLSLSLSLSHAFIRAYGLDRFPNLHTFDAFASEKLKVEDESKIDLGGEWQGGRGIANSITKPRDITRSVIIASIASYNLARWLPASRN